MGNFMGKAKIKPELGPDIWECLLDEYDLGYEDTISDSNIATTL